MRPIALDRRWNVDPRADAPPLESLIADVAAAGSPPAAIEGLKPNHFIYTGLKQALARYRGYEARGGWPAIPLKGPSIKPGASDARMPIIRQRLVATGDLDAKTPDTGEAYGDVVQSAVQKFQERHRLAADGAIGRTTLDAMNVSAAARADQVRANMERARWVLAGRGDSFVLVNLPAFKVYLIRHQKNVWESRTVIGQNARQTPAFRAEMRYIVFNPEWTVPPTIVRENLMPNLRGGRWFGGGSILSEHGLKVKYNGRIVDAGSNTVVMVDPSYLGMALADILGLVGDGIPTGCIQRAKQGGAGEQAAGNPQRDS